MDDIITVEQNRTGKKKSKIEKKKKKKRKHIVNE